jgi:hypothetical protein
LGTIQLPKSGMPALFALTGINAQQPVDAEPLHISKDWRERLSPDDSLAGCFSKQIQQAARRVGGFNSLMHRIPELFGCGFRPQTYIAVNL